MKTTTITMLIFIVSSAFAHASVLSCPNPEWISSAHFIEAKVHPYDDTQWNLNSPWLLYKGDYWQVYFGSFFPEAHTANEALTMGQQRFSSSRMNIPFPEAIEVPGFIQCDYTSNGGDFWISALKKQS